MIDKYTMNTLLLALEVTPENIPLRKHIAGLLSENEEYDEAESILKEGLKQDPHSTELMCSLSQIYSAQGKNGAAFVLLEEVVSNPASSGQMWLEYARLLRRTGQENEAREAWQTAMEKDPSLKAPEFGPSSPPERKSAVALGGEGHFLQQEIDDEPFRFPDEDEDDEEPDLPEFRNNMDQITFKDVGGMEKVKDEIQMKIILPLTNQDLYAAYGKKTGGGILMYGPPGCGKTYLARATAGEVNSKFVCVGLHDVLTMWVGESEQQLHRIFEGARKSNPCVLFFDEVDALGAKRTDMRQSAGRHLINQFLSELDGVDSSNDGLLILAATNAPWHLDSAFRRPGRFDRILFVPPPDQKARAEILRLLTQKLPVKDVDYDKVAAKTPDYSGADLKAVVDFTIEQKLRESMKAGKPIPLVTKDLLKGAKQVRSSVHEWFASARNHAIYANESGLYDEILTYLK